MAKSRRRDPDADPFRPPAVPIEVGCLHCGREYDSYLIEWREQVNEDGEVIGFWCCPTPGCDGIGFGFDILPTDPEYQDERGGWVSFDDDEDEDDDQQEGFEEDFEFPLQLEADQESNGGNGDGNADDVPW